MKALSWIVQAAASAALLALPLHAEARPAKKSDLKSRNAQACAQVRCSGEGFAGPYPTVLTRYVSAKKGERRCDSTGGPDTPAWGSQADKPGDHRWQAGPREGWVMVALPPRSPVIARRPPLGVDIEIIPIGSAEASKLSAQDQQALDRDMAAIRGTRFRARDVLGGLNPHAQRDSAIPQIDISTDCAHSHGSIIAACACSRTVGGTPGQPAVRH